MEGQEAWSRTKTPMVQSAFRHRCRYFADSSHGSEYCGNREHHEFALYLNLENIEHTRTKAKSPQTNGICERFHQTIQNEFYASAFRRKIYTSIGQLQADVDQWGHDYNMERTHSGKHCFGKTPWQTLLESKHIALEKQLDRTVQTEAPSIQQRSNIAN
ncbi:integrase core domain-containing protein [Lampropedia puyangensis]|uniref:integrase core domain-containing protein n=1 Tax=Lampropedia puyangensis TaxID=1330072 RepID=UPI0026A91095